MRAFAFTVLTFLWASQAYAQRTTVSIGDTLVSVEVDRRDGVQVAELQKGFKRRVFLVGEISLPMGSRLEKGTAPDSFCSERSISERWQICLHDLNADGVFEQVSSEEYPGDRFPLKAAVPYVMRAVSIVNPTKVPRKIIYLGGTASEIRLSYREFTSDGLARPAFTEELTVPLSTFPVTLSVKGFRMTIHGQSASGLDVELPH